MGRTSGGLGPASERTARARWGLLLSTLMAVMVATLTVPALAAPQGQPGAQVSLSSPDGVRNAAATDVEVSQAEPAPELELWPGLVNEPTGVDSTSPSIKTSRAPARRACAGPAWMGMCAYAGYALPRTCKGDSWCGVLGALTWKNERLFHTDPAAPATSKYGGVRKFAGSKKNKARARCSWSQRTGRVGAYVMSKFGPVGSNNRRAAAVDVALNHILCRGNWRIDGPGTQKRLSQAKGLSPAKRKGVKRLARKIVSEAQRQAGPYKLGLSADAATAGQPVTVRARLRSAKDRPAANRLLVLRMADGTTTGAYTNATGQASWTFTMPTGTQTLRVTGPQLESPWLWVRTTKNKGAARPFLAGRTTSVAKSLVVTTKQQPTLTVTGQAAKIPDPFVGTMNYSASLGSDPKTVTVQLRGPFSSAGTSSCTSGTLARTATFTITGNGSYRLPSPGTTVAPKTPGWYQWSVVVSEDAQNTSVQGCSNPHQVKPATPKIPQADMLPTGGTVFAPGENIAPASFKYIDGYGTAGRQVKVNLWGPFTTRTDATCAASSVKIAKSASFTITAPSGTYNLIKPSERAKVNQVGWYRFEVNVAGNTTNEPTRSCGAAFRVAR